jgi:hypothetical protein
MKNCLLSILIMIATGSLFLAHATTSHAASANIAAEPDGSAEDRASITTAPVQPTESAPVANTERTSHKIWALTFTDRYVESNLSLGLVHNEYASEAICHDARREFLASSSKLTGDDLPLSSMMCTETLPNPDRCSNCTEPSPFSDGQKWQAKKRPDRSSDSFQETAAAKAAYVRHDYRTALKLLQPLADQGNAPAMCIIGEMNEHGEGIKQDIADAAQWYRKAADQGMAQAQFDLGRMYYQGRGVKQDYLEAVGWFRKAADQGFADAQSGLGSMYARGQGVLQDNTEAMKWFRKAADQGSVEGEYNVGVGYDEGLGVPHDDTEANKWFQMAAQHGNKDAQDKLAERSGSKAH